MHRPGVGGNCVGGRIESEVKFPSAAFRQIESRPDSFWKVRLRNRYLQAQCFYCRALLVGVMGIIQLSLYFHGIRVFCCLSYMCNP